MDMGRSTRSKSDRMWGWDFSGKGVIFRKTARTDDFAGTIQRILYAAEQLVYKPKINRDRHCAYRPVASIGGRSLDPAAIMLLCILTLSGRIDDADAEVTLLMRLQMMLETRTTRFQTVIRSEEVFGYILLVIKKLTLKKLDD
ncbi:hypothetical protein Tco_1154559 [Tanacetum coccineum]